jgi:hypothetical protein
MKGGGSCAVFLLLHILVRPDEHVAWRSTTATDSSSVQQLRYVFIFYFIFYFYFFINRTNERKIHCRKIKYNRTPSQR